MTNVFGVKLLDSSLTVPRSGVISDVYKWLAVLFVRSMYVN